MLLSDGGDKNSVASLDEAVAVVSGIHVEAVSLTTPKTDLGALTPASARSRRRRIPPPYPQYSEGWPCLLIPATIEAAPVPTTVAPTTVPATTVPPTTAPTTAAPTTVPAPTSVVRRVARPAVPGRRTE